MSAPPEANARQDAFISYTHDNNLPLDDKGKGWVDHFHQHLDVQLRQYAGRKVAIWRDPALSGNSVLPDSLKAVLKQSDALVIILSPGYLNSDWCMAELQEFCTVAEQTGGLHLNGKSRIFVVAKLPLDEYPPQIAQQLRYDFFERNGDAGPPDEFRTDLQNRDERYWLKLRKVAWDLHNLLKAKGPREEPTKERKNPLATSKGTIYLAETTADLSEYRRKIREELTLNGYNVVPDGPLPYVFDTYCEQVKKHLSQAIASINLVGRTDGIIPEGADNRSILRLQLDLANESASARAGFKRMIWMPEKWEASDEKMRALLQELRLLTDRHTGFEFLQTSFEEFKNLMHSRLKVSVNGHQAKTSSTAPRTDRLKVYLICDERDIEDATPLIDYLQKERRHEVVLPEFEEVPGDTALSVLHQQTLLECDGAIVYWGHGNSRWANSKKADLERLPGLEKTEEAGNMRPLRAKTFYVAGPADVRKNLFDPSIAPVIKNSGGFDPALLNDFIRDLEGGNDAKGGNDNV